MAASHFSGQNFFKAASWLGRLLLCLSLLLNLSTVVVGDIKWSNSDQFLDSHQPSHVTLAVKGNESKDLQKKGKEQNDPRGWIPLWNEANPHAATPLVPMVRHRHHTVPCNIHTLLAPFLPRAPTA